MVCSVLPAVEAVTTPPIGPSPLLAAPGAVAADGADAGVAAHYGDPLREQRLLTEGLAAVDLSHRGVVTVTGPDRLSWLHSITTQMLTGLAPLVSAESLVLSPKGHIEHDLHLVDDGETTWITTEPGTSGALAAWLSSMRFMLRVEVADVTADWAVVGEPMRAPTVPGEPLAWSDPWPRLVGDTAAYSTAADHPGEQPAWRPRLGFETDHRTIPHEVDWLRTAVHLHKGCYRGQETVARVHNLGRPPRRLVMLNLDGTAGTLPEIGEPVTTGAGRTVGRRGTVAQHHELGPIALALGKRSVEPGTPLLVAGIDAMVDPDDTPEEADREAPVSAIDR